MLLTLVGVGGLSLGANELQEGFQNGDVHSVGDGIQPSHPPLPPSPPALSLSQDQGLFQ